MNDKKAPKRTSWQRISLIALCGILAIVLGVLLFVTIYINYLLGFVTIDGSHYTEDTQVYESIPSDLDPNDHYTGPTIQPGDIPLDTLPSIPPEDMVTEGIVNILLIGEDRFKNETRHRSDSMILCSFNLNDNSMTMISFLRDTYVSIPGFHYERLNAAYAHKGYRLLNETLATNFGVRVDADIIIDFDGFEGIINMLGGVDIELTEKEAKHLNKENGWKLTAGMQHLDGKQALAYSRIRRIDMDAMRAQRQRKVLTALINRYRNYSLPEMLSLASDIVQTGFVKTSMTSSELTGYIVSLFPILSSANIRNQQIPAENTYTLKYIAGLGECKIPDLEKNRKILQQILN